MTVPANTTQSVDINYNLSKVALISHRGYNNHLAARFWNNRIMDFFTISLSGFSPLTCLAGV